MKSQGYKVLHDPSNATGRGASIKSRYSQERTGFIRRRARYLIPSRSRSCTDCYSKTHRHYPAGRRTNKQRMRRRPRSSEWRSTEQDDDYCLESKIERAEGRKKESHNKRTDDGNRYLKASMGRERERKGENHRYS